MPKLVMVISMECLNSRSFAGAVVLSAMLQKDNCEERSGEGQTEGEAGHLAGLSGRESKYSITIAAGFFFLARALAWIWRTFSLEGMPSVILALEGMHELYIHGTFHVKLICLASCCGMHLRQRYVPC